MNCNPKLSLSDANKTIKCYEKNFKVSIIVNCYNGEKYLSRCLQSIINQTEKNWEVIFLIINLKIVLKKFLKSLKMIDLNISVLQNLSNFIKQEMKR